MILNALFMEERQVHLLKGAWFGTILAYAPVSCPNEATDYVLIRYPHRA